MTTQTKKKFYLQFFLIFQKVRGGKKGRGKKERRKGESIRVLFVSKRVRRAVLIALKVGERRGQRGEEHSPFFPFSLLSLFLRFFNSGRI